MKSWMVEVRQSMTFSVEVEAETKQEAAAKACARVEADDTKLEVEHSVIEAVSLMQGFIWEPAPAGWDKVES